MEEIQESLLSHSASTFSMIEFYNSALPKYCEFVKLFGNMDLKTSSQRRLSNPCHPGNEVEFPLQDAGPKIPTDPSTSQPSNYRDLSSGLAFLHLPWGRSRTHYQVFHYFWHNKSSRSGGDVRGTGP